MGKSAAETRFIVHLGILGDTQRLPNMAQKSGGSHRTAVRESLSGRITGNYINRVETVEFGPPLQVMGHMINLAQLMRVLGLQSRVGNARLGFPWVG
jgi:hypothetical protein